MEIVPPCLKILRLLTEYSWSCRRHLANKMSVYTTIVMCSVVCRPSVQVSYEAACLLALLLFDEVAQCSVEKGQRRVFSLPSCLVKRYVSILSCMIICNTRRAINILRQQHEVNNKQRRQHVVIKMVLPCHAMPCPAAPCGYCGLVCQFLIGSSCKQQLRTIITRHGTARRHCTLSFIVT